MEVSSLEDYTFNLFGKDFEEGKKRKKKEEEKGKRLEKTEEEKIWSC